MTPRLPLLAILALQTSLLVNIGAPADPEHLRYQRAVVLPAGFNASVKAQAEGGAANSAIANGATTNSATTSSGAANSASQAVCAVLDATVLAHSAAGGSDLRLYRSYPGSAPQAEVPYRLTESGPEPVDAATVAPTNVTLKNGELHFDLHMPARAYSELRLELNPAALSADFLGTVLVTATATAATPAGNSTRQPVPLHSLGSLRSLGSLASSASSASLASSASFPIFNLPAAGLGRWTTLLMAEGTAPVLHLTLALRTPEGRPIRDPPLAFIASVAVPPSRERQTVYVPVATTAAFSQSGGALVATLHVPAHVPIEALRLSLQPGAHPNFARDVVLTARSDDDPFNEPEILDAGLLQDVHLPSGDPRLNPIAVTETNFSSTLGATLASSATVRIAIANRPGPALPLAAATLLMRERRLCFTAAPGFAYTLRYGDPALVAPFYADVPQVTAATPIATLGPQLRNPGWTPRHDTRPFFDRHPELFWLLVLACTGMMGGTALQFVQHRAEETRR